jgi:hypothetical protein
MTGIEGGRFRSELTPQYPHLTEQGIPHAELVAAFRTLIRQQQETHAMIRAPHEREVVPPETVVRGILDWYSGSAHQDQSEIFFTLRSAWDALVYDQYEPGSREEGLAGSLLQGYYGATQEPTIRLTDSMQVRVLDALAEAADIPHQRGQSIIEIPEKLRNYNQYLLSPEYQERFTQAQAKKKR